MTEVGASLNASIRSGAGFGTLVMAVVMLMQTVSPLRLFCHSARRRNVGSRRRGELRPMARRRWMEQHHEFIRCRKTNSIPREQL
jgi:hypothetical protein